MHSGRRWEACWVTREPFVEVAQARRGRQCRTGSGQAHVPAPARLLPAASDGLGVRRGSFNRHFASWFIVCRKSVSVFQLHFRKSVKSLELTCDAL